MPQGLSVKLAIFASYGDLSDNRTIEHRNLTPFALSLSGKV